MARYRKSDIDFHAEGWGEGRPAVRVKVDFPRSWDALCRDIASAYGERDSYETLHPFDAEWLDAHEHELAWTFGAACEEGWERLQGIVEDVFEPGAKVYSEGRSSGWAVVEHSGLPEDVEAWGAIAVSQWGRFAVRAREIADDIPYQMAALAYMNLYEQEKEAAEWYKEGC